jgi:hypothetical protein
MSKFSDRVIDSSVLFGRMWGNVVENVDPEKRGRIGVYIPRVMALIDNFGDPDTDTKVKAPKADDLGGSKVEFKTPNFMWARPLTEWRRNDTGSFGRFCIPPVDTKILVEFIDGDPKELYWYPLSPIAEDDEQSEPLPVPGESIPDGNPYTERLWKSLGGSSFGFTQIGDENKHDKFWVEMKKGGRITITETDDGTTIEVDSPGMTNIVATKDIHVKGRNIALEGDTVTLLTSDSAPWIPNTMPICPFTGAPHGITKGSPAGPDIVKLSGVKPSNFGSW